MFKTLTKGNNSLRSNRFPFVNWHIFYNLSDLRNLSKWKYILAGDTRKVSIHKMFIHAFVVKKSECGQFIIIPHSDFSCVFLTLFAFYLWYWFQLITLWNQRSPIACSYYYITMEEVLNFPCLLSVWEGYLPVKGYLFFIQPVFLY